MAAVDPIPTADTAYRRGVVFVLVAGMLWSMVGLGIRLIDEASVWQILFYRSLSLTPFLFVVIWWRSDGRPFATIRKAGKASVVAGIALVGAYAGGIYAIQETSVASALLLFAAAPFIAAALGWLVLGEPVRRATGFAMVFAVVGVGIMVADGFSSGHMIGNIAALASSFAFAVFTVALRWGKAQEMLPSVFLSGLFALALSGLVCVLQGLTFAISANDMSIALVMGVFQIGAGLVLYTIGSNSVPAAELTLLSLGEVLIGPFWVWLFLGETIDRNTVLGGSLLLAAIVGNALSGLRRKPPILPAP
ncbi:MAG: DMT family transporter [Alphaproteobacteria bacterium]|nr:DMT family transporter [Alphaproteobacteria bacterium]